MEEGEGRKEQGEGGRERGEGGRGAEREGELPRQHSGRLSAEDEGGGGEGEEGEEGGEREGELDRERELAEEVAEEELSSLTLVFDACGGHVDRAHRYHYHLPPVCLLRALGGTTPVRSDWWVAGMFPKARV